MANETKIQKMNTLIADKNSIREEIRELREVRRIVTDAVNQMTNYEDIYLTQKRALMINSFTSIIRSLKSTFKNIRNYSQTMVAFNKDDFASIDIRGGTVASVTPGTTKISYGSNTATSSSSSNASSSSGQRNSTTTAAAATTAATTAAATPAATNNKKTETIVANESGGKKEDIPRTVKQASSYTVTCYGPDGWHLSGREKATPIARDSNQKLVHNQWVANGARYKNGIAVMNVNGEDRYLIATTQKFGNVGDLVDVKLANEQVIKAVIADTKAPIDHNYHIYGHSMSGGSINIVEFEVDRLWYLNKGNPNTDTWKLEWKSDSPISSITNIGSVL